MNAAEWIAALEGRRLDAFLTDCYGADDLSAQRSRYAGLAASQRARFSPSGEIRLFSTPGRTELGGNHTDHNRGKVLAASVHLDSLAAVARSSDGIVELYSEGFPEHFVVDVRDRAKKDGERGKTEALIRGVASRLAELGYEVGGFKGCVTSNVLRGSGLSSSASIEVLIGSLFSHLYNDGRIPSVALAVTGQFAENTYFDKPCGLEDQLACATGGIIGIDFRDPAEPAIERIPFNFLDHGYSLIVVDTGGTHDDLTADYAAIPTEMRAVAAAFGKTACRDISRDQVLGDIPRLRTIAGDRAILRSLHFFADNERVERQVGALKTRDIGGFLAAVRESGSSSWRLLQNCWSPHMTAQPVPVALALSEIFLAGEGASRVHGGGFAGTIQAFVPKGRAQEYVGYMEGVFGPRSVTPLRVRNEGTIEVPLP